MMEPLGEEEERVLKEFEFDSGKLVGELGQDFEGLGALLDFLYSLYLWLSFANKQHRLTDLRLDLPESLVKKPDGSYRLVQDLREVNKRTQPRYPVVPNPYTLLSKVPPQHQWFSVVDLKDAFWACPLAKESRDIFAFEWEDPKTGRKKQLRWMKLPQGFTESPNLFGQALEKILQAFSPPPRIQIIQYVDDLLLSGEDEVEVREATIKLLNFLRGKGLRVSKGKLQFVEPEVLLTTEAAIRTKERRWIHASRIKGPVDEPKE
ncbi:hypothetical protein DUI87_34996 [Hirundo rustica rustica]|uniref:ribonuclease H n=1 Tax=Hirundo rustica rustica TaxID=333673 RepID=A0A3M0IIS3_HIRRU|nr:hypothetical protein DUI87_34996 [Hirundo rustica rustica]